MTHADHGYKDEYDRIFGVPIAFDCGRNALLVDDSWLNMKIPEQPRYVIGVLSERAEALLRKLEVSKTVHGRVESLPMRSMHRGDARVDVVAAEMKISRWTLARRLKEEGTTFAQVLDALRREIAIHYLSGKKCW